MAGLLATMLGAVLVMRAWPDLPLSRLLHDWLARRPAAWLLRRTRREIIAWSIAAGLLMVGGEYVLVLGGPHAVMAFAVDLAAYVDALVAVATLASLARIQAGRRWLALRRFRGRRSGTVRSARRAVRRRPANDGDDDAGDGRSAWALAA